MAATPSVSVQAEAFDTGAEVAALAAGRTDIGAVVSFTGLVRDLTGDLEAMTLEHYPGMTERELAAIAEDACKRWPLDGVRVIHRYGRLTPGDPIVLVVTASAHRRAAFEAADFLMDYLKTRAPFWKKESRRNMAGGWVEAKAEDDADAARWEKGKKVQK